MYIMYVRRFADRAKQTKNKLSVNRNQAADELGAGFSEQVRLQ